MSDTRFRSRPSCCVNNDKIGDALSKVKKGLSARNMGGKSLFFAVPGRGNGGNAGCISRRSVAKFATR